jgi:CRISPR-associated protein Csd2
MGEIKNRYEFVLLFDVTDGNPNGDPDAGNLPRVDAETGKGLVTDVCLKRKIRNFIQLSKNNEQGYDIFIKEKAILNNLIEEAHEQEHVIKKEKGEKTEAAKKWMCQKYFDVRTFGAVMSTGKNAGQVRGPIQLTFGRSINPIVASEHSITRMAVATEKEAESQGGDNRTMGRKFTVPYGLYQSQGFISPHLASQTGFSEEDLEVFWEAVINMFEHDHSASRGMMNVRELIVFKHELALGNAPSHKLFDLITVESKDKNKPPREYKDYEIQVEDDSCPDGVEILRMV